MPTIRTHRFIHSLPGILFAAAALAAWPGAARGTPLTTLNFSIQGTGGLGGAGTSASDMVFKTYGADGWGWAGGAGGVQGSAAITNTGGTSIPTNEVFQFNLGTSMQTLNSLYGEGAWEITNLKLTFASSYAKQNNSRFGVGSGTFSIYWVENDNWAQSKGTADDKQRNPIYASTEEELSTWAGGASLLGEEAFTIPPDGSGYVTLTYNLSPTLLVLNDLLTDDSLSLYLMGTSDSLGMIIFTGGQGQALPTISFDVVSVVPEPGIAALLTTSACLLLLRYRRKG